MDAPPSLRPALVLLSLAALAVAGCANPTRPGEAQPMVEVQVNDSRETTDDYVSPSSSVPARARITNDAAFDTPVAVTLKNARPSRGGQVRFGSGLSNVATLSLPDDGSWASFTVQGASGQLSGRDKDAVIEVAEDRADGIVLARKALQVVSSVPSPGPRGVAVDVGRTRTSIDDYLTWSPRRVQLALTRSTGTSGTVSVTVRNMTPVTGGRLAFAPESAISTPPQITATRSSLSVNLPRDGSSVTIWVAGDCQIAGVPGGTCSGISEHDKDAVLEVVHASTGAVVGRKGMMVRIRKDANTLTADERDRFLDAVAELNMTLDNYQKFQDIHSTAASYAHGPPAFLAWHRVFVLQIERELQALDPAVALPYWKFDDAAPNVYDQSFMGDHAGSTPPIASTNPLDNWSIRGPSGSLLQGITRDPEFSAGSAPSLRDESPTLAMGDHPTDPSAPSTYERFRGMEGNPHGSAHTEGGGTTGFTPDGWLAGISRSVMDPIFFLLHSNVDRLWAKWQFMEDRYDPAASESYAPQGSYPGSGASPPRGHYAEDTMWPWDRETSPGRPSLSSTPGTALPQTIGRALAPPPEPTPADVVPYDANGVQPSGLGFAYDDVPFRP